ncbi:hypothetical protein Mal64_26500 [Pseudobythopirellula maris]|uniref:Secreted protein n=1 Tax=Pseudobythopirellula maris TaxID=2527991 RepID=A0A5C5ZJ12_9BACT|nr:hypothetical protein [Pseudobythopirellula maris]TWT87115.1 hypothetical protein Mal64_26500 [Pseudobythopirellula maris]
MPKPLFTQRSTQAITFLLVAAVGLAVAARPAQAQDGATGSPDGAAPKYKLTIDSQVYDVPVGEAFAVRIDGRRVAMRLDPEAFRTFDEAGVSFNFPGAYQSDKNDADQAVTIWTFQGKTSAVMLQRYSSELDPFALRDVLVGNIVERYGEKRVERRTVKLRGQERSYEGIQIEAPGGAAADGDYKTRVLQNVFTFANRQGVFALIVQDARSNPDEESSEYRDALKLMGASLVTGPEPAPTAPTDGGDAGGR